MAQAARRTTTKAKPAAKKGASRGKAASTTGKSAGAGTKKSTRSRKTTGATKKTATAKKAAGTGTKKSGARKTAAGKSTAERQVSVEERRQMIAEAAYYKAQDRGFSEGDPQRDWIEAEAEIDATLLAARVVRK